MKPGDLVKQVSWDDVGIIVDTMPYDGFVVLFPDGKFSIEGSDLELISERRCKIHKN